MGWENIIFDGFDGQNIGKWDAISGSFDYVDGRHDSKAVRFITNGGFLRKNIANSQKICVGFAAVPTTLSGYCGIYIDFYLDSAIQCCVAIYPTTGTASGTKVYQGASTLVDSSTLGFTSTSEYIYIEVECYVNDSGQMQVKFDGETIISYSGDLQALASEGCNNVRIRSHISSGLYIYIDDLYIRTGETTDSNGFLGDIRIDAIVPTADTSKEFTPSTGTDNYACIDEIPASETDYVTSGEYGTKDIYRFTNTLSLPGRIIAVQQNTLAKKSTTGISQGLKHVVRVNGTDYKKDAFTPDSTSQYFYDIWETNPDNDNEWDIEDINALDAGLIAES